MWAGQMLIETGWSVWASIGGVRVMGWCNIGIGGASLLDRSITVVMVLWWSTKAVEGTRVVN